MYSSIKEAFMNHESFSVDGNMIGISYDLLLPCPALLFPIESIWQSICAIYKTPKWADDQREKRLFEVTIHKVFQCSLFSHKLCHASLILLIRAEKDDLNMHTISHIFHPYSRCHSSKTWNMLLLPSYKLLFYMKLLSRAIFFCWVMARFTDRYLLFTSHNCLSADLYLKRRHFQPPEKHIS